MRVKPGDKFNLTITRNGVHVRHSTNIEFVDVLSAAVSFAMDAAEHNALITDIEDNDCRVYHFTDTTNATHLMLVDKVTSA